MGDKAIHTYGYGPDFGVVVAKDFATNGYKLAVIPRSDKSSSTAKDSLQLQAYLSVSSSVEDIYKGHRRTWAP